MKLKKQPILIISGIVLVVLLTLLVVLLSRKYMWFFTSPKTIHSMSFDGQFYPAEKSELKRVVANYLETTVQPKIAGEIKIMIVPHAGYDYSASVAASAYKSLAGQKIKRVYLIGNSHRNYFSGLAVDNNEAWETPLGLVRVDTKKAEELAEATKIIKLDSSSHREDHVLEVQLPFLQVVLGSDFKIVPLLFGNSSDQDYQTLGEILAQQLEPGDLVVISSDMSHYPPPALAQKIDQQTLDLIIKLDLTGLIEHSQAALDSTQGEETILCGLEGVKTALFLAKKLNLSAQILNYQNSGDFLLGDKKRVVGYGAIIFTGNIQSSEDSLNREEQTILLNIAQETINNYITNRVIPSFDIKDERLKAIQGAFVTLHRKGELRGCIGEIVADQPLWQVVQAVAIKAATQDSRFSPVTANELTDLEYEISVLSPPQKITDWRQIKLGRDGVIIQKGLKGGVFLPQVALETSWSLEEFLNQLCVQKAGLEAGCYQNDPGVEISVFQAQVFK